MNKILYFSKNSAYELRWGYCLDQAWKQTLQNICLTGGFYIINLLMLDQNPSITFSWCKSLRRTIKIMKIIWNRLSDKIKTNFMTLLVLLDYILLVLLYYILYISNQMSHCDMI